MRDVNNDEKMLIGVDGSGQAFDAVYYAANMMCDKKNEIVLFHAIKRIDESFYDLGISPTYRSRIAAIRAWESQQKKNAAVFMDHAQDILIRSGILPARITVKMHFRKVGIARDIIKEAKQGYCAVVVGRKGISRIKDLMLGSTSVKLVEKLSKTPVWIVGGKPNIKKALVAVDTSDSAMRAVTYAGRMLSDSSCKITLLNVARSAELFDDDNKAQEQLIYRAEKSIIKTFEKAKRVLMEQGIEPARISTKFIPKSFSRAGTIIEEAKKGRYGTIIMGRRGTTKVEDFFMGRVSNKVVTLAKKMAVWVVN